MDRRHLFRWVGSKAHVVERFAPRIRAHLARTGGRLVSLFYGSGRIEQVVGGPQVAADACPDLCALYEALQADWRMVFDWVYLLDEQARGEDGVRSERAYRVIQRMRFDLPAQRAARFLWLSAMAFNGLWRVNSRGENNVGPDPARLAGKAPLPPMLVFERAAEAVREVEFWLDWGQALSRARAGDVVLADPPYGTFSGYTAGGFGEQDHHALSIALEVWMRRHGGEGGAVVAFNAPGARKLYSWARVEEMARSGRVNSKATARGRVAELLITAGLEEAEGPA